MKSKIFFAKKLLSGLTAFAIILLAGCKKDDGPPPATASFDFDATTTVVGQAPLNVQFTNESENATTFAWDFGDGNTSTEESPAHTYANGGDYEVSLTVTNSAGVEAVDETTITLASPLAGIWVLDSLASPTIDTIAAANRFKGAFEFGTSQVDAACPPNQANYSAVTGWSPSTGWTGVLFDAPAGYFSFWSETIFSGNYFGRIDFFENEFSFSNDGSYEVDLKGELRFPDFYVSTEADYSEADDWSNIPGAAGDLSAFKSGDAYTFSVTESADFPGYGKLTLTGEGAFLGSYFSGLLAGTAGTAVSGRVPQPEYHYIISSVSADQLIVGGFTDITCASNWTILKFKKVN